MCSTFFEIGQLPPMVAQLTQMQQSPPDIYAVGTTLGRVKLQTVDEATVTILIDNFIDETMPGGEWVKRLSVDDFMTDREHLIAEHGYSLLLTVKKNGHSYSVLYDAGLGRTTLTHNMQVLGIKVEDIGAVILSHGHADHFGGLEGLYQKVGRRRMPLVIHPDAWLQRRILYPTGNEVQLPSPSYSDLAREGVEILEERGPSVLFNSSILVTGQVERVTDFETGYKSQQALKNGAWQTDSWTWDDQALVINVKDKGLLILSGCSHAGVINVIKQARRMTGVDRVYAFVGGMHLSGALMEPLIHRTLVELTLIRPEVVVPGHCTGWKATHQLARVLPESFVHPSVGTNLYFGRA